MAYIDEYYETKKASFYSDKIILKKKKGDIIISRKEIDKLCYARPTFLNYMFAHINQVAPGQLVIRLKKPTLEGKKAGYLLRIKYADFLNLPLNIKFLTEVY